MPLTEQEKRTASYQWGLQHPRIVPSVYDPPIKGDIPTPRPRRTLDAAVAQALHLDAVASALRASTAYKDVVVPPLGSRVDPPIVPEGSAPLGNPGSLVSPPAWTLDIVQERMGYVPANQDELRRALTVLQVPAAMRIAILVEAQARGYFAMSPPLHEGPVNLRGEPLPPDPDAERARYAHEAQIALALIRSNKHHNLVDVQHGARVTPAPVSEYQPGLSELVHQAHLLPPVDHRQAVPPRTMHAAGVKVGDMSGATADGCAAYDGTAITVAAPAAPYALASMHSSLAKLEAAMQRSGRGYSC